MAEKDVAERVAELITKVRDEPRRDDEWVGGESYSVVASQFKDIGSQAVPFLLDALATEDPSEGYAFASIIAEIGEQAVPALAKAYESADEGRRWTVVSVCCIIGMPALSVLRLASNDSSRQVRLSAVTGLKDIGEPALEDLIRVRFSEPDRQIHGVAGSAIRDIGAPAVDPLAAKMSETDPDDRLVAVRLLGGIGLVALAPLSSALEDPDKEVRADAVKALCSIGEPALGALATALGDDEAATREMAINCISAIGLPALDVLAAAATSHEDDNVRMRAVVGLGKIGEPALDAIVGATDDCSASVRSAAYSALYQMAGAAPRALHALVAALEDEDGSLVTEYYTRLPNLSGDPQDTVQAIMDELITRASERPDEHFSAEGIGYTLEFISMRYPRLKSRISAALCDLAFEDDERVRSRAVAVARRVGTSEFAALVRERAATDPDTTWGVMGTLGGADAAAFFAEQRSEASLGAGLPVESGGGETEDGYLFILMPMGRDDRLLPDVEEGIKRAAERQGLRAERIDDIAHLDEITEAVLRSIRRAEYIVADLTHSRPNVYYELGYAHALGKKIIRCARDETQLHFDVQNYPTIFFANSAELEARLDVSISRLAESDQG